MTRFSRILVTVDPLVLAVVIGLIDLALNEMVTFSLMQKRKWKQRLSIYCTKIYKIRQRTAGIISLTSLLLFIQLLMFTMTIILELSISHTRFPSQNKIQRSCYRTARVTRVQNMQGPSDSDLDDERVIPYLNTIGCSNSLISQVLIRPTGIYNGYPTCLSKFQNHSIGMTFRLQGSAVAYVANSRNGDPSLAYGVEENGSIANEDHGDDEGKNKLASTSIYSIVTSGNHRNSGGWPFDRKGQRVMSNVLLPLPIIHDHPEEFDNQSTSSVVCTNNDLECYHEYAATAHSISNPIARTFSSKEDSILMMSHKTIPSFVCVLNSVDIDVWWVYMNQYIPDVERNGRSGPVPTRIHVRGPGRCVMNMPKESARMYIDSMERVIIAAASRKIGGNESVDFSVMLQQAAVIMGMRTSERRSVNCTVFDVVTGCSIGRLEASISIGLAISVVLISMVSAISATRDMIRCPLKFDPLNMKGLMRRMHAQCITASSEGGNGSHTCNEVHFNFTGDISNNGQSQNREERFPSAPATRAESNQRPGRDSVVQLASSNDGPAMDRPLLPQLRSVESRQRDGRTFQSGDTLIEFQKASEGYNLKLSLPLQ